MTPLTVCCLYVQGEYPYTLDYVTRLRDMVSRWIDRPFRFVCLTDQPWAVPTDIDTIPVMRLPGFAFWTKLEVFNPARAWQGRVLYLDLDTLIVSSLAPILDFPASFAITDDRPLPGKRVRAQDRHGRQIVRRFNSSVMVWDGGTETHLYRTFDASVSERLSGDQDHIAEQSRDAAVMPRVWFPRLSEIECQPLGDDVKVVLSKHPKNHIAATIHPWFGPLWGSAA